VYSHKKSERPTKPDGTARNKTLMTTFCKSDVTRQTQNRTGLAHVSVGIARFLEIYGLDPGRREAS